MIKPLWWLWLPTISFVIFVALEFILPSKYHGYIIDENGVVEILQFLVMAGGCILAALCLKNLDIKKHPPLAAWFGLAFLGCLYIAGEEISWGQHFIGWTTPEGWQAINDQQETNLHNTTSWLDQKPRLILEIGVIVGGLLLPLVRRFSPTIIPGWFETIAPPDNFYVIATVFLAVKLSDKIGDFTGFTFFSRPSEITELYIFYFITLYLYFMLRKLKTTH